jgi:hypothetical protein
MRLDPMHGFEDSRTGEPILPEPDESIIGSLDGGGWEHGSLGSTSIPGTPGWLLFFFGAAVAAVIILFWLVIYFEAK